MAGRLCYPAHEARHPWLAALLDAYRLLDESCARAIAAETERRGAAPACGPGCRTCCVGQVIPVSAFEALGLWWYAAEVMDSATQDRLAANISCRHEVQACPFLLDSACSAYPLRPLACRRHHVFGARCAPGENLRQHRPGDVFTCGCEAGRDMAWRILPLYGVERCDIDRQFETGYVGRRSRPLHELPLEHLVTHMTSSRTLKKARHA